MCKTIPLFKHCADGLLFDITTKWFYQGRNLPLEKCYVKSWFKVKKTKKRSSLFIFYSDVRFYKKSLNLLYRPQNVCFSPYFELMMCTDSCFREITKISEVHIFPHFSEFKWIITFRFFVVLGDPDSLSQWHPADVNWGPSYSSNKSGWCGGVLQGGWWGGLSPGRGLEWTRWVHSLVYQKCSGIILAIHDFICMLNKF